MNTKQTKSGIAGGILLIGLGILAITGTWWPGIWYREADAGNRKGQGIEFDLNPVEKLHI